MQTLELPSDNQVFNPCFIYPNATNNFPAGWQKYQGKRFSSFEWLRDEGVKGSPIKIKNHFAKQRATIIQQRSFEIPVCDKQVWEIGAVMGTSRGCYACLVVHFTSSASASLVHKTILFSIEPGDERYYFDCVQIPPGVTSAYIEIGLQDAGTLWIDSVIFQKIFPVDKYDADCGRLNINHVESVGQILEPLSIQQPISIRPVTIARETRDTHEEVIARSEHQFTPAQDVFNLNVYSYCIINSGNEPARAIIQLSPNGQDWLDENNTIYIANKEKKIVVSQYFLRYIRLQYWTDSTKPTILQIYFQGQG